MAFDTRLRTAAYRSPSGATFDLQFDEVEHAVQKKVAIHELPLQDKASVQDLGNQAERIPFACYFTGQDYDTQADAFFAALSERGAGSLQHPRYGNIPVLALSFSQTENLVDGLGRADFRIEFVRVQEQVVFPITSVSITTAVEIQTITIGELVGADMELFLDPIDVEDLVATTSLLEDAVAAFDAIVGPVIDAVDDARAEFDNTVAFIENNIDALIEAPLELAQTLQTVVSWPAKAAGKIKAKIDAYVGLFENVKDTVVKSASQAVAFWGSIAAFFVGAVTAVTTEAPVTPGGPIGAPMSDPESEPGAVATAERAGQIASREEAVLIAETLEQLTATLQEIAESIESQQQPTQNDIDAGIYDEIYQPNAEAVTGLVAIAIQARDALLERAYTLRTERRITLQSDRTPVDLVYELYGDLGSLDEFIETNELQGDDIILIPAGREVIYYAG